MNVTAETRTDVPHGQISAKRGHVFRTSLVKNLELVTTATNESRRQRAMWHLQEFLSQWSEEILAAKELQGDIRRQWHSVYRTNKEIAAAILLSIVQLPLTDEIGTQTSEWMDIIWDSLNQGTPEDIPHIIACLNHLVRHRCVWADRVVDGTLVRIRQWLSQEHEDTTVPHEMATRLLLALKETVPWLLQSTPELRHPTISDLSHPLKSESASVRQLGADCIVALLETGVLDLSAVSLSPLIATIRDCEGEKTTDLAALHGTLLFFTGTLRSPISRTAASTWEETGLFTLLLGDGVDKAPVVFPDNQLIQSAVLHLVASIPYCEPALSFSCLRMIHEILFSGESDSPEDQRAFCSSVLEILPFMELKKAETIRQTKTVPEINLGGTFGSSIGSSFATPTSGPPETTWTMPTTVTAPLLGKSRGDLFYAEELTRSDPDAIDEIFMAFWNRLLKYLRDVATTGSTASIPDSCFSFVSSIRGMLDESAYVDSLAELVEELFTPGEDFGTVHIAALQALLKANTECLVLPTQKKVLEMLKIACKETEDPSRAALAIQCTKVVICLPEIAQEATTFIKAELLSGSGLVQSNVVVRVAVVDAVFFAAASDARKSQQKDGTRSRLVYDVLEETLQWLIADPDDRVRLAVASGLENEPTFDAYLCTMGDAIEALVRATNDSVTGLSSSVYRLLCRLAGKNTSAVQPVLTVAQRTALNDIVHGLSIRAKQRSCNYLATILSEGIVGHSTVEAERSLIASLRDCGSLAVQASILNLLAEYHKFGGSQRHVDPQQVLALVEASVDDSTYLPKQLAALRLLRTLLRHVPALETAHSRLALWGNLRNLGFSSDRAVEPLRRAALRTLGTLGAIDPSHSVINSSPHHRQTGGAVATKVSATQKALAKFQPPYRVRPNLAKLFPSTALYALFRHVAYQHGSTVDQLVAIRCAKDVLAQTPSDQLPALVDKLMPLAMKWLRDTDRAHIHAVLMYLLQEVCVIFLNQDELARKYGSDLLNTLADLRSTHQHNIKFVSFAFVGLVQVLATSLPEMIRPHTWTVAFLVERLAIDRMNPMYFRLSIGALTAVLRSLQLDRDYLGIISLLLDCLSPDDSWEQREINQVCVEFFSDMVGQPAVRDQCANIFHQISQLLEQTSDSSPLPPAIITFLCQLLTQVGRNTGRYFLSSLEAILTRKNISHEPFQQLIQRYRSFNEFPEPAVKVPTEKIYNPPIHNSTVFRIVSNHTSMNRSRVVNGVVESLKLSSRRDVTVTVVAPTASGSTDQPQPTFDVSFAADSEDFELNMLTLFRRASHDPGFISSFGIVSISALDQSNSGASSSQETSPLSGKLGTVFQLPMRRREMDWVKWLANLELSLINDSPHASLRAMARLHDSNAERSILPFAVHSYLSGVDDQVRASIMEKLSQVLSETTSHAVRSTLFTLAEFMESERTEEVTNPTQKVVKKYTVTRPSTTDKFGINYHKDQRGVYVKKITKNLPGGLAKVPEGAVLISIDGREVKATEEIKDLVSERTTIELVLETTVPAPICKSRPFFDIKTLATVAEKHLFHERAIHYTELLFEDIVNLPIQEEDSVDSTTAGGDATSSSSQLFTTTEDILAVTNSLIDSCHTMGLDREAKGVLKFIDLRLQRATTAPEKLGFDHIHTLEKLNWWNRALDLYQQRVTAGANSEEDILGVVRCHKAMGNQVAVVALMRTNWELLRPQQQNFLAPQCAEAAFTLGEWDLLHDLVPLIEVEEASSSSDTLRSVATIPVIASHIQQGNIIGAKKMIDRVRFLVEQQLVASSIDSAVGADDLMVQLQHVTHLEEVIQYKSASPDRCELLHNTWKRRVKQMAPQPMSLATSVAINRIVLKAQDDLECQLQLCSVCRKADWVPLAQYVMTQLLDDASALSPLEATSSARLTVNDSPLLATEYCKQLWFSGKKQDAHAQLKAYLFALSNNPSKMHEHSMNSLGKAWMMLGQYESEIKGLTEEAQGALRRATELIPQDAQVWHAFGMMQYLAGYKSGGGNTSSSSSGAPHTTEPSAITPQRRLKHFVTAIESLFNAVKLSTDVLGIQDTLRIVAMWFQYGNSPPIREVIDKGIKSTPLSVWLRVIPQLVARLGMQDQDVSSLLEDLLGQLGKKFPHLLVRPLVVCEEVDFGRYEAAQRVLAEIRRGHQKVVLEYSIIREDLIALAIIWAEKWHDALQNTRYSHSDCSSILRSLQPLFTELENPKTPNEREFEKMHGTSLRRARNSLAQGHVTQAWNTLNQVFTQVRGKFNHLSLSEVAPRLAKMQNCSIPVPGQPENILIHKYVEMVQVISSKQRPRKFGIVGTDGEEYHFLLKGHEDLRQDERAMQLFSLINTVLSVDPIASVEGLSIETYNVTPLSSNVGIVGWIEKADTIYKLIEARRHLYGVSIMKECKMIEAVGKLTKIDEYHKCSLEQRKTLLQHVFDSTAPTDLRAIFWDQNESCKTYLQHRKKYTHSQATMCMVGYILGLGDRHLNNLMITQTGAVAHVDFGDCFEVVQKRQYYPEAVPFRLTRQLTAAMGVTEVEGAYRSIAEHVMGLMRKYKESLLSVLETFVYDPVIAWRFSQQPAQPQQPQQPTSTTANTSASVALADVSLSEKDEIQKAVEEQPLSRSLAFSLAKSTRQGTSAVFGSLMHSQGEPMGEWKRLADYLDQHASELETLSSNDVAFPEHITPTVAVDTIRAAVNKQEFTKALAWLRYSRQIFPDSEFFRDPEAAKDERQSLHNICLKHSLVTQQNDVAKGAIRRVQVKLMGTDFLPESASISSEGNFSRAALNETGGEQQVIFFGTTPHQAFGPAFGGMFGTGSTAMGHSPEGSPTGQTAALPVGAQPPTTEGLDVPTQVGRLIDEARSLENLAQAFITGWSPFW